MPDEPLINMRLKRRNVRWVEGSSPQPVGWFVNAYYDSDRTLQRGDCFIVMPPTNEHDLEIRGVTTTDGMTEIDLKRLKNM